MPGWISLTPTSLNFGKSVSGGENSYTFINYKPLGCTCTFGCLKTHSMYGQSRPYNPTWALKAGGDTKFLSDAWDTGYTWYSILWTPPPGGNTYIIFSYQYGAAWLNINNVDPLKAADPSMLGTALADAEALLEAYPPMCDFKADPDGVRAEYIMLAGILTEFNKGYLGVPYYE